MAQVGRPSGRKKTTSIQIRLNENVAKKFDEYCRKNSTTKTDVITNFIELLLGIKKDNQ